MTSEPLAAALAALDDDWTLARLADLVTVPSVSGSDAEAAAVERVAGWAADEGLDVDAWQVDVTALASRPGFPGMEVPRERTVGAVARLGPGTSAADPARPAALLLDGHVDVVPVGDAARWSGDPFGAAVVGGRMLGRGTCDMKAGVVAALAALRAVRRAGVDLAGDVLLAPVVGEEDGGLGTYALLDRGYRAAACVIPEPTSLDVVPANAGALTFRLEVEGRAAHGSRRSEGVSAVEKAVPLLTALAELEAKRNVDVHPLLGRWPLPYPLSVGRVAAGDWASTVPERFVAEGRYGVALGEPVARARAQLEAMVASACAADPWLADHPATVTWWGGQFASGALPDGHPLLATVVDAVAATTGRPPDVYGAPYGSDLRLLTAAGVPTVQCGPGDADVAHTVDESVPVVEVLAASRVLVRLVLALCAG